MFKPLISVASMIALLGAGGMVRAQDLILPSIPEATDAIVDMLADTGMPRPSKVKLGTCIPAVDATYPGQVACTVAVTLGAAVSENQMDFYKQDGKWKAQPSVSQDKLPFPDPKLD
ncbi:hypothetical protein [Achromobacter sp.]|uniref:hypothetical protein n=1 Tax=Achromobacter sp. TaxID=134375 RepID=UPI002F93168A